MSPGIREKICRKVDNLFNGVRGTRNSAINYNRLSFLLRRRILSRKRIARGLHKVPGLRLWELLITATSPEKKISVQSINPGDVLTRTDSAGELLKFSRSSPTINAGGWLMTQISSEESPEAGGERTGDRELRIRRMIAPRASTPDAELGLLSERNPSVTFIGFQVSTACASRIDCWRRRFVSDTSVHSRITNWMTPHTYSTCKSISCLHFSQI